jgi:probable HAF family extracellular repeat protein
MRVRAFTLITAGIILAWLTVSFPLAAQGRNTLSSAAHQYTVEILPGLGGIGGAFSINNLGWAAGVSDPSGDTYDHAFLWRNGQGTDLGTLGGHNSSMSFPNKNEIGWLVGPSETADDDPYQENFCQFICSSPTNSCLPFNQICKGFLWRAETNDMIAFPPLPGGNNSYSTGANNRHQIVGIAENGVNDPNCIAPQVFDFEGVVWRLALDGTPVVRQRLGPITGDAVSVAIGINDDGDVVGASGPCTSIGLGVGAHAVLWKDGRPIDLGSLGGVTNNIAFALNNRGQVVGISDLPGDSVAHSFLWEAGAMKDLGTLRPDDFLALPESINDRGEVVGFSCGPVDCRGFHWQTGVMTDLNSFLPADSPLLITNAADINARGKIAVQAWDQTVQDFVAAVLMPTGSKDKPLRNFVNESNVQHDIVLPKNIREQLLMRLPLGPFRVGHPAVQ